MIYNLVQYLRTQFPAEVFYPNAVFQVSTQDEIPDRRVLVQQGGGVFQMKTRFTRTMVQVVTFDISSPLSRALAYDIFSDIGDRNGLILPAITVNGVLFPQVETDVIRAMSPPQVLTTDEAALSVWTTNYQVSFTEA